MAASSRKHEKPLQVIVAESNNEELRTHLRNFARELAAEISNAAPERSEEVLSALIAELALSAADQRRLKERKLKQAEGIAAAQARGVHFGRPAPPLPDDFDECRLAWRSGEMSLLEAAKACGMRKSTFRSAVLRKEQFPDCPA